MTNRPCIIVWCVALATPDHAPWCVCHEANIDLHPQMLDEDLEGDDLDEDDERHDEDDEDD